MTTTKRMERLAEAHLSDVLGCIEALVEEASPEGSTLPEMCRYHMSTGGKRLRALLPLAVAELCGQAPAELVPFAAACELLHNATLVHDDLQDGDRTRRGEPTVWVRYGEARAINLGDAMLYYTLLLVDRLAAPVELRSRASRRLLRETIRVIDGQEREFLLQSADAPDLDGYFTMVEGKTSGLFALPIAGAAEICGADPALVEALSAAAGQLGVLFQLQDDLLDLWGDKGRDRPGTDIAEGKVTALVLHGLRHADDADASWLRELLRRERETVSDHEIARAIALLESTGARDFAFAEIDRRRALALEAEALVDRPDLRAFLDDVAELFLDPIRHLRDAKGGER